MEIPPTLQSNIQEENTTKELMNMSVKMDIFSIENPDFLKLHSKEFIHQNKNSIIDSLKQYFLFILKEHLHKVFYIEPTEYYRNGLKHEFSNISGWIVDDIRTYTMNEISKYIDLNPDIIQEHKIKDFNTIYSILDNNYINDITNIIPFIVQYEATKYTILIKVIEYIYFDSNEFYRKQFEKHSSHETFEIHDFLKSAIMHSINNELSCDIISTSISKQDIRNISNNMIQKLIDMGKLIIEEINS